MAKKNLNTIHEESSDEEELFSYLTKVKQPELLSQSPNVNQDEACVDQVEIVAHKDQNTNATDECSEVNLNAEDCKDKPVQCTVNDQKEFGATNEQTDDNNAHLYSKVSCQKQESHKEDNCVGGIKERRREPFPENEESRLQRDTVTDEKDRKQYTVSSGERDRYYLINEKDWLTLCERFQIAENIGNVEGEKEAKELDSSEKLPLQELRGSSLEQNKSPKAQGKSLISDVNQYNCSTKTTLKESHENETKCNFSSEKTTFDNSPNTRSIKQSSISSHQPMSQDENKMSVTSEIGACPKVEIVYIRLEDGHIRYDVNKSPRTTTKISDETCLNTVKKLDFSQQNIENSNASFLNATINKSNECIDLLNDTNTMESNYCNSDAELVKTAYTQDTTKHGMQMRFVRIDNKLTRVYENVKYNAIDEVFDASYAYDHNKGEQDMKGREEQVSEENRDNVDVSDSKKDSFNFNDSQLIAFPLNAVDPKHINTDDSLALLTPSKLDILNISSSLDPLTPSKLEFLSNTEMLPSKVELFLPSKLGMFTPGKQNIIPNNESYSNAMNLDENFFPSNQSSGVLSDEKIQTEAPLVLKVTKSGTLVECYSKESSPLEAGITLENSQIKSEGQRKKSHIQNLWEAFKPVQRKIRKDRSVKEDSQVFASESLDDNDSESAAENDNDGLSIEIDNDDLSMYFSSPICTDKKLLKGNKSVDLPKTKSVATKCSVAVQAYVNDVPDEHKVYSQVFLKTKKGRKVRNTKSEIQSNKRKMIRENNASQDHDSEKKKPKSKQKGNKSKTIAETGSIIPATKSLDVKIEQHGVMSTNTPKDDAGSCINSENPVAKKKKGRTGIFSFHTDCNFEQVELKDFEKDAHKIKMKKKNDVVLENEETDNNVKSIKCSNLKQSKKRLSGNKEDKASLKKRKVANKKKNTSHNEIKADVHEKRKDSIQKSCLKKGDKCKGSKSKEKTTIKETETNIDESVDTVKTQVVHKSQSKINFLENLFHIKLKEADISASCDIIDVNKSQGEINVKYGDAHVREEKITGNNVTSKEKPIEKICKNNKEAGISNNDQISKPSCSQLNVNTQNRRKACKQVKSNEQGNASDTQCIYNGDNLSKMQEQSTLLTKPVYNFPHQTRISNRHKKLDAKLCINSKGMKHPKKESILRCDVENKSNMQRTSSVKKKSEVFATKSEILHEDDNSSVTVSDGNIQMERSRFKAKDRNNTALEQNEIVNKISKYNQNCAICGEENRQICNSFTQNNKNEDKKRKSKKYCCSKKLTGKQRKITVIKSKNIDLNTSSSMDEMVTNSNVTFGTETETVLTQDSLNENNVTKTEIVLSQGSDFLSSKEGIYIDVADCKRQETTVSILATFQEEEDVNKSPSPKSEESVCKGKTTRKRKKKLDEEEGVVSEEKNREVVETSGKKVSTKIFQVENGVSVTNTVNLKPSTDIQVEEESQDVKNKAEKTHKQCKILSPKKLRTGKVRLNKTLEKGTTPKSVKSSREPYSRRKLKSTSKRLTKESWKELLDDEAFNVDLSDKTSETHKPINVKHIIKNILKNVKGKDKEKTESKKNRHRERKEKRNKNSVSSSNNSQAFTSESDDAWLSDSGKSASFPAFKFTSESDSETVAKQSSNVLMNENLSDSISKHDIDSVRSKTSNEHVAQNYIDLHHFPIKVSDSKVNSITGKLQDGETENLCNTDSKEVPNDSKASPDIKKNVDKLIALLDKVNEQEVVKKIKFV